MKKRFKIKPKIKKRENFLNNYGTAQTGTIIIMVFIMMIVILGLLFAGGPGITNLDQNAGTKVILLSTTPEPSKSTLQLETFFGITVTPYPGIPAFTGTGPLRISINNSTGWNVDAQFHNIGVTWTRLDIGEGGDLTVLSKAISDGMHPLALYTAGSDGNCTGLSPAQVTSDISALVPKLLALGINELEFCNEVYITQGAATYAAQYNAAHIAAGGRIKLIAVATNDYLDTYAGKGGSGNWFNDMKAALPGGVSEIDGWTLHPYPNGSGDLTFNGNWGGWPMIPEVHDEAIYAGFSPNIPWYITETGVRLDQGASEALQASDLTQMINDITTKYPYVVYFNWYASRSDTTGDWGLLDTSNNPRPAFNALQTWMSANSARVSG